MKSRIFVSYARPDLKPVKRIVSLLKAAGFPTWFDQDDLLVGDDWSSVIKREIAKARLLLLCLSTKSVDRTGFFQKEMRLAVEQAEMRPRSQVFILPVQLNACSIPDDNARLHVLDLRAESATDSLFLAIGKATGEGASAPISEHRELREAIDEYNYSSESGDAGPTQSSEPDVPSLSREALTLLKEAVEDPKGTIFRVLGLEGLFIRSNGKEFVEKNNPRASAILESALEELEAARFDCR